MPMPSKDLQKNSAADRPCFACIGDQLVECCQRDDMAPALVDGIPPLVDSIPPLLGDSMKDEGSATSHKAPSPDLRPPLGGQSNECFVEDRDFEQLKSQERPLYFTPSIHQTPPYTLTP